MARNGKGRPCAYCKRRMEATDSGHPTLAASRDHVVPEHAGGTEVVWCCVLCNITKGGASPDEWQAFMVAVPLWWRGENDAARRAFRRIHSNPSLVRAPSYLAFLRG